MAERQSALPPHAKWEPTMDQPSPLKPDLPNVTPITCETCSGPANLIESDIERVHAGFSEKWTFKCETCGQIIHRIVES